MYSNNPYILWTCVLPHIIGLSISQFFWFGPLFFIDQTVGSGILSLDTFLDDIFFSVLSWCGFSNSFSVALINIALSGWLRDIFRCMVPRSNPMKAKIWSDIKVIGCGSDWTSISGYSSSINSSLVCCGETSIERLIIWRYQFILIRSTMFFLLTVWIRIFFVDVYFFRIWLKIRRFLEWIYGRLCQRICGWLLCRWHKWLIITWFQKSW